MSTELAQTESSAADRFVIRLDPKHPIKPVILGLVRDVGNGTVTVLTASRRGAVCDLFIWERGTLENLVPQEGPRGASVPAKTPMQEAALQALAPNPSAQFEFYPLAGKICRLKPDGGKQVIGGRDRQGLYTAICTIVGLQPALAGKAQAETRFPGLTQK
jgi:hypothetical protein